MIQNGEHMKKAHIDLPDFWQMCKSNSVAGGTADWRHMEQSDIHWQKTNLDLHLTPYLKKKQKTNLKMHPWLKYKI